MCHVNDFSATKNPRRKNRCVRFFFFFRFFPSRGEARLLPRDNLANQIYELKPVIVVIVKVVIVIAGDPEDTAAREKAIDPDSGYVAAPGIFRM